MYICRLWKHITTINKYCICGINFIVILNTYFVNFYESSTYCLKNVLEYAIILVFLKSQDVRV